MLPALETERLNRNLNTYIPPKRIVAYLLKTKWPIKNLNTYIQTKRNLAYHLPFRNQNTDTKHIHSFYEAT